MSRPSNCWHIQWEPSAIMNNFLKKNIFFLTTVQAKFFWLSYLLWMVNNNKIKDAWNTFRAKNCLHWMLSSSSLFLSFEKEREKNPSSVWNFIPAIRLHSPRGKKFFSIHLIQFRVFFLISVIFFGHFLFHSPFKGRKKFIRYLMNGCRLFSSIFLLMFQSIHFSIKS